MIPIINWYFPYYLMEKLVNYWPVTHTIQTPDNEFIRLVELFLKSSCAIQPIDTRYQDIIRLEPLNCILNQG